MKEIHHIKSKEQAVEALKIVLHEAATNSKVLLLLPGGSAADVGVSAVQQLTHSQQKGITLTLTDERYGPPDHANANLPLLNTYSIPSVGKVIPVLTGQSPEATARAWERELRYCLEQKYTVIALFGVGTDNHIAGIKPGYNLAGQQLTAYYTAADFERITITPAFFKYIDEAFIYAEGPSKEPAVNALKEQADPLREPAQLIKDTKHFSVYYCNK